jgi:hypothetical protein
VRLRTSDRFTYNMGSHAQRFGDVRRVGPELVSVLRTEILHYAVIWDGAVTVTPCRNTG